MEELLKNDIIELTVEGQGINGEGVARTAERLFSYAARLKAKRCAPE